MRTWNPNDGQVDDVLTLSVDQPGFGGCVKSSPDLWRLAVSISGTVAIADLQTGEWRHTLRATRPSHTNIVFSPDGRQLAVVATGDRSKIWNMESGDVEQTLPGNWPHAFSHDGSRLMTSPNRQNDIVLRDLGTGDPLFSIDEPLLLTAVAI
ncbi:MAG: hypothetical protein R3300_20330, partial [Candidatus Promineifilaceae bacterium]|nr:hypothetical protein [Candidatus Promineifilaceae bacterium]